ncbi:hypothetical protein O0I10_002574 [Lichtheimia ornata]|uniref:UBA domain-containing protein n=1 Tax=Lichtheimia ornata TaxID=688661 RepID=A0AAD7VCN7_9FUNG|nr:uncharacterized protein O0I10_002574 [Lichtheimia ornata]KAJ8661766.1 hypothetical protein O0I10_002574 [Lichtheimia ornata]
MDDLLDLNWAGDNNKNKPPSIPQKPSYLAGNPTSSNNNKKQDAFADLLNLPSSQKPTDRSQLPLAEQQRLMRQEAMGIQLPASFTSMPSSTKSSPRQQPQDTFGSLLDPFGGKSSNTTSNANTPLNALRSQSSTPNQQQSQAQWNFDLLDKSKTTASSPSLLDDPFDAASLPARSSAPPQQSMVDDNDDDEDNPLGILSKPVQKPRTPSPEPEQRSSTSSPHVSSASPQRQSPPPNDMMVAQLMDMGFSDEQAKVALEVTGGNDLQDAIDLLVQNAEAVTIQQRASSPMETSRSDTTRARQSVFHDDNAPRRRPPPQDQPRQPSSSDGSGATTPNFQQHKEKLVAQATELGGFLYKNASMFVKTGRERINKAVEDWQEQQRAEQRYRAEGRPKWMRDDINDDEMGAAATANRSREQYTEKFVDDDSSDEDPALEREREIAWKKEQEAKRREYVQQMRRQQQQERERIERQQDENTYVSPSRRRAMPSSRSSSRAQTPVKTTTSTTPMTPPSKKQRSRPVIKASDDVMMRVNNARKMGNDKFKLGQFGEAEDAYTQAITMLPDGHDHLVILCNNRAATRLKIGEYKKCIEDCVLVVEMAESGGDDNIESEGVTIRWREQISKALHRKGEALEHMEKYKDAIKAYEHIVKLDGANNAKVNQALARCRRALNPPPASSNSPAKPKSASSNKKSSNDTAFPGVDYSVFEVNSSSTTTTPPASSSLSPADIDKSKAVAAMRAQAAKQEAEDAERMQKTDDVNARILQWKSGKENNLRALLATLDTLLWPGAQWRGANMSELINPKKCKIIYMKAIAKVHPDKLPSDVTVEQRMLASAIFSTLNEAWDSFKSQV